MLAKRDNLSADFIDLTSKKIQKKLGKIDAYKNAQTVAAYYSIGSEVKTQGIIQEILSEGKTLALPRVVGDSLVFCSVKEFDELEKGEFGIMEPKQNCPPVENFDVILMPAVAMTRTGQRLGYGKGFYDRFLKGKNMTTIALTYASLLVRNIPRSNGDIPIQWVVTEDEVIKTS